VFLVPEKDGHPADIAARLLSLPEHQHLKDGDATIDFLFRVHERIENGRLVLGSAHLPQVTGKLRDCFEWMLESTLGRFPDFLIVLDKGYWDESDARLREILIYHELLHCGQKLDMWGAPRFTRTGEPMWCIRGHDIEEFNETVTRYGQWSEAIRSFVTAAGGTPLIELPSEPKVVTEHSLHGKRKKRRSAGK
jgi:hypothetical protein